MGRFFFEFLETWAKTLWRNLGKTNWGWRDCGRRCGVDAAGGGGGEWLFLEFTKFFCPNFKKLDVESEGGKGGGGEALLANWLK